MSDIDIGELRRDEIPAAGALLGRAYRDNPFMVALSEFAKRAPAESHWHLGPVGVHIDAQGAGIGSLMIKEFCARIDAEGDLVFLETDLPQNVRLYERFGFETIEETNVIGAPAWFMLRRPRP